MGRKTSLISSTFAACALTLAVLGCTLTANDAFAAPFSLADCFTHEIRSLLKKNDPVALAKFEARIRTAIAHTSPAKIEAELESILETFAKQNPDFPRAEFQEWVKKHPLTTSQVEEILAKKADYGTLLDARYQLFRHEKEVLREAEELLPELKAAARNPEKLKNFEKGAFRCLTTYPVHKTAMASAFAVQVVAYGIMASQGQEFSYDLLATNTLFNFLLGEKMCREVENMTPEGMTKAVADRKAGIKAPLNSVEMKKQMKNYFFGKTDPATGLRPGLARAMFDRQMKYIKYAVPYAGMYGIAHGAQGHFLHGKKITFGPLSDIPENERDQYVSLNPISLGKDAVINMLFYDIPFANQRNILLDPLLSVAIPNLLKHTAPIFIVQSGVRTASTYLSTEIFRCWEKDKKNIYGCIGKVIQDDPSVKAVIVPEKITSSTPASERKPASTEAESHEPAVELESP